MTPSRARVGIVGLGSIGRTHARVLAELSDQAVVVAASGGSPAVLAELGLSDTAHLSPDELLTRPDIDLVAITGPSGVHGELALAALRGGKAVVVEKPLAVDTGTAAEIVRLGEELGLMVAVVAQRRLEPQNVAVKRLLDAGELGRPLLGETFVHWHRDDAYYAHADWRTSQADGGGSLMNQGLHNLDLLHWFLGPVSSVTGHYATLGHTMDAEDTTVATLRFASGALGLAATTTATRPGDPARLTVFTSTGVLEITHTEISRWEFDGVPRPAPADGPAAGSSDPAAIGDAGHLAQWRDILAAYRDGRDPAISGRDGLGTVELLCGIYEACRTGRAVTLTEHP
ncbi:putative dehydrogenase [Kribbella amoyensis]|uniref:Putative dehydrogenase n=1 Tax=Kribbella amoyensis TaxID=996641 RepID=A0A561C0R1_9ACTN|nr:Gfo/Idh/MocA family oxidoreductase [Kribbella amoyensis]TWD84670.1 putative dehydrogenase [Kribbella amoyensis]